MTGWPVHTSAELELLTVSNMLNPIQSWLSSAQDYEEGLTLLKRYRPQDKFFRIKNHEKKTDYTFGKLRAALRALQFSIHAEAKPQIPSVEVRPIDIPVEMVTPTVISDNIYPQEIEQAMLDRRSLANKRDKLANSLGS